MRRLKFMVIGMVVLVLAGAAILTVPVVGQTARQNERERRGRSERFGLPMMGGSAIGATVRDPDEADVKRQKLTAPAGAVIDEVRSDGAAARAGLRSGDLVVEFDGEKVRSARQFTRLVQETPAHRSVKAVVMRDGGRVDVTVTPDPAPQMFGQLGPGLEALERARRSLDFRDFRLPEMPDFDVDVRIRAGRLGIGVMELRPQLAEYFGVQDGVLVTSVSDGSAAERAGVKAGDVITTIDGTRVGDAAALRRQIAREDKPEVTLGIVRDRKELTLKVSLEPRSRPGRPI